MIGLAGIGAALLLGIAMRIAAASGALMLMLMHAAAPILENNPFMDDHLVYALVLVGLALVGAGRTWAWVGAGRRPTSCAATRSCGRSLRRDCGARPGGATGGPRSGRLRDASDVGR